MAAQATRDTAPEMALRRALHGRGLRYRVGARPVQDLRRTADIVFTRAKVAVFVDGCFWHQCPEHGTIPRVNREWWATKLQGNVERDQATTTALTAVGWTVIRCWEHEDPASTADLVEQAVGEALATRGVPPR